ncbi:MAG: helix-turn-helix transcriptional regulator [Alphaproteobacteria bacterium]|nr:helix-turn-helix transcriptional regulator [Alphaproteobacteria bacterium]
MEKLANNARKIRKSKKMTLEQVAARVGTTHVQIRRLENGERRLTQQWMVRLADALGVKPIDLIDDSSEKTPEPATDRLLYWVIDLCVKNARAHPELPEGVVAGIGTVVYRSALSGKLPDIKPGATGKKPPKSLEIETQRLLDYEIDRVN